MFCRTGFAALAIAAILPSPSLADVCAPSGTLFFSHTAVSAALGLSLVVETRRHPATDFDDTQTIAEQTAAVEAAFLDIMGNEPAAVQDLRLIGAFADVYGLLRYEPQAANVYLTPELVRPLIAALERQNVPSGAAALTTYLESFLDFDGSRPDELFEQLVWGGLLRPWSRGKRDEADALLIASRAEVEASLERLISEDSSVGFVMADRRESLTDWSRKTFLERALERCLGDPYLADAGRRAAFEALPEPQQDMLALFWLDDFLGDYIDSIQKDPWMLEPTLRATQIAGLDEHAAALRSILVLFSRGLPEDRDARYDMIAAREEEIYRIVRLDIIQPLSAGRDAEERASGREPLGDAIRDYAVVHGLWPHD